MNPTKYQIQFDALKKSYDYMIGNSVPKKLIFNPKCKIIDFDDHTVFFYIVHLMKMPIILKDVIQLFNGKRPHKEIISIASKKYHVDIDIGYIRHLFEQEILISST